MKRIIPVLLVSALAVIGCDNKKQPTPNTQPAELQPQPLPPAPTPTPAPMPSYEPAATPTPAPAPRKAAAKPAPAPKAEAATPSHKTSAAAKSTKATHGTYTVKKGDTLAAIAKAHKTTIKKIVAVNHGLNPDRIYVGQKLKMP